MDRPALRVREALPDDSGAIARIYNEGIEDRVATFETRPRSLEEIRDWFGEHQGLRKLLAALLAGNEPSRALMVAAGFREVGRYEKQAQLEGAWKDVLLFEKLLPEGAGR
jgi:L-amino acid N-acyltransferase YncA